MFGTKMAFHRQRLLSLMRDLTVLGEVGGGRAAFKLALLLFQRRTSEIALDFLFLLGYPKVFPQ